MGREAKPTQKAFTKQWCLENALDYVHTSQACPALEAGWFQLTGKQFRDPEKMLRSLFADNFLERHPTKPGSYRINKTSDSKNSKQDFSIKVRLEALDQFGLICKTCKRDLDVDEAYVLPKVPFNLGGKIEVENAQVLCAHHALLTYMMSDDKNARRIFEDILEKVASESSTTGSKYKFLDALLKYAENLLKLKPSKLAGSIKKKR